MTTWLDRRRHLSDEDLVRCLDRERRPHADTRLLRHLAQCHRCRQELSRMEGVLRDYGVVREAAIAAPVQEFATRARLRWATPLFAGAAVACAVVVVSNYRQSASSNDSPGASAPARSAASAPVSAPVSARVSSAPLSAPVRVAPKAVARPKPAVPNAGEVAVRFAVHRACECLGQPLSVTRQAGRIVVEGVVSDFRRRDAVADALRGMPNVDMRIRTYEESAESRFFPCGPRVDLEAAGLKGVVFTQQIAAYLSARQHDGVRPPPLAVDALSVSRTAAAEAEAFRQLMKSYPAEAVAAMDIPSRERLRQIAHDYVEALADRASLWRALLDPGSESLSVEVRRSVADWRTGVIRLCESVRTADRLTRRLLSEVRPPPEEILASRNQLRTAVAELDAELATLLPGTAENILP